MIELTRPTGATVLVNPVYIARMSDRQILLSTGEKILVKENLEEIQEKINALNS